MARQFRNLLNRKDLPTLVVQYDTTFDFGNYYYSWITFTFTEFENTPTSPMPTIGLACFIHNRKLQKDHEYFWTTVIDVIPELASANNVVICTDEEIAIVNAIKKVTFKFKLHITSISQVNLFSLFLGSTGYSSTSLLYSLLEKSETEAQAAWNLC